MDKIRLISFDKDDYKAFYERHVRGSIKIFLFTAVLLNLILALPIHLLSDGKELRIYGDVYCNMFVICTAFSLIMCIVTLVSGYWCVINNLSDGNWGISVATFISFGVAYNIFIKVCTWPEAAIGFSIFASLCVTYVVIKCCK